MAKETKTIYRYTTSSGIDVLDVDPTNKKSPGKFTKHFKSLRNAGCKKIKITVGKETKTIFRYTTSSGIDVCDIDTTDKKSPGKFTKHFKSLRNAGCKKIQVPVEKEKQETKPE